MAKMKKPDGLAIVIGIGKASKMKKNRKKPLIVIDAEAFFKLL